VSQNKWLLNRFLPNQANVGSSSKDCSKGVQPVSKAVSSHGQTKQMRVFAQHCDGVPTAKVAHRNLKITFLGKIQRMTIHTVAAISEQTVGGIRCCKKEVNIINDARIKTCIARHDNASYTRLEFPMAESYTGQLSLASLWGR